MTSQPSAADPTTTRKVWQYSRAGSMPEILEQKTVPLPKAPADGDGYLIRIAAVSINPTNYQNGDPGDPTFVISEPETPSLDFAVFVLCGQEDGLEGYGEHPTEQT